jgi:hypothetical protein
MKLFKIRVTTEYEAFIDVDASHAEEAIKIVENSSFPINKASERKHTRRINLMSDLPAPETITAYGKTYKLVVPFEETEGAKNLQKLIDSLPNLDSAELDDVDPISPELMELMLNGDNE